MVGRGGSCSRSFANILSLPFSVYQMFQKAKLSSMSLFIFHEKSKYKLHLLQLLQLLRLLQLLHPLQILLATTVLARHCGLVVYMAFSHEVRARGAAWSVTQSSFKDGGVSRGYCHRRRNKRSLCG